MSDQNNLLSLLAEGRVEEFLRLCDLCSDLPLNLQAERMRWQVVNQKLECINEETIGWQYVKRREKSVRVRTRRGKESFEFDMRAQISAGDEIIAIINSPNQYPKIIPFCNKSEIINAISPSESEVLIESKVPFLDSRFLKARISKITSSLSKRTIIFVQGVPLNGCRTPPGSEIKLNTLIISLTPCEKSVVCLTVYALLDDAVSYLPNLLISKLLQIGVTRFFEQISALPRPSL